MHVDLYILLNRGTLLDFVGDRLNERYAHSPLSMQCTSVGAHKNKLSP